MRLTSRFLVAFALLACVPAAEGQSSKAVARPRVILVGWDGADWQLLDPLVSQGKLPNLAKLLSKGRSWNLETYEPMASPLIWTTIATGRTPVDHGVCDFQELDPKTRTRLPVSSRARKVPAIWNLASAKGVSVGVVGWWATWPAEKVNGFLVSDRASSVLFDPATLARSPALAWPENLADGVRLVGRREGSPGYEDVAKGLAITRADFDAAVAEKKDLADPVTGYQKILGSTRVYARSALDLYARNKPELLLVYFQGTDEIGHLLARYHPPKMPEISDQDFRKYSGGVVSLYVEADRVLGELMAAADREGATLVLVSDHGFKWSLRPSVGSIDFNTAFQWHETPGVMAAAGPAITPSKARGKATVFDVTPTLCRLLGLPADPAFEGKPVTGLDAKQLPRAAPPVSWAKTATVERLVASSGAEDKKTAEEFTKKLIALGYLTGAEASAVDARPPDRAGTETAGHFMNIGTFLRIRGDAKGSIDWYKKALEVQPTSASGLMNLSNAYLALSRFAESDEALIAALKNNYGDPKGALHRRTSYYNVRMKKDPKAARELGAFLQRLTAAFPERDDYLRLYGHFLFQAQQCAESERVFGLLAAKNARDTESLNLHGLSALCLGKLDAARASFERSLAADPGQEKIRETLAKLPKEGTSRR